MKARVRPSASCTRRRIISQDSSTQSSSSPLALRMATAGCPFGISNTAVTWPCSAPWRTKPASPRPPSASANASRRMDLPAPVSPVSTARPREHSISSRSIRTMSRIERRASMRDQFLTETQSLEGPRDIGPLVLARLETTRLYKIIRVFVPAAVRKIVPENGGGGLRLADDTDRHIGLGQARECLFYMPSGLILRHHRLEAVDGGGVIALVHVIAADAHFAARKLVARAFQLLLGAGGVFRRRIFANHFLKRRHRLLGSGLIARDVRDLVVMRGRDQVLRIGGVGTAGMQGDVTRRGADTAVVVAALIERIGRHQQRFARPIGIRMLAIGFLEFFRRGLRVVVLVHQEQALVIELVRGLIDEGFVLGGELVPYCAGAASAQRRGPHA